jgi:hypothetical protein
VHATEPRPEFFTHHEPITGLVRITNAPLSMASPHSPVGPFIDREQMTLQAAARNESGYLGVGRDLHPSQSSEKDSQYIL